MKKEVAVNELPCRRGNMECPVCGAVRRRVLDVDGDGGLGIEDTGECRRRLTEAGARGEVERLCGGGEADDEQGLHKIK